MGMEEANIGLVVFHVKFTLPFSSSSSLILVSLRWVNLQKKNCQGSSSDIENILNIENFNHKI